jgi:pimeloyl-ACP methyl ester carboxylesterase
MAFIDAVALSPWGSPFYLLVQDYVGVFRQIPAYMHEAMVAAYIREATYQPMDDDALKPYIEPWLGAEGQEAFYRQISQNDPRYTDEVQPLYARIDRPVMIVWGEQDRWIPLERGQQLHEAIPGSQLKTIPGCAHLAQEDAPDTVAEYLTDFFASQREFTETNR